MVLLLEYMVLTTMYRILLEAITVFMFINVCLVYKIIYKLALFSILLFKCKFYLKHEFGLFKGKDIGLLSDVQISKLSNLHIHEYK